MSTLLRSQVECPACYQIIASIHRHDFQTCRCGETSLDGGRDYMRLMGNQIIGHLQEFNRSIVVADDLDNWTAARVLTVLKCTPDDTDWPLTHIIAAVQRHVWELRGEAGRIIDVRVSRSETRDYLKLLARDKLVKIKYDKRGRMIGYQRRVSLADHPGA